MLEKIGPGAKAIVAVQKPPLPTFINLRFHPTLQNTQVK
jgi:hypothetical protein